MSQSQVYTQESLITYRDSSVELCYMLSLPIGLRHGGMCHGEEVLLTSRDDFVKVLEWARRHRSTHAVELRRVNKLAVDRLALALTLFESLVDVVDRLGAQSVLQSDLVLIFWSVTIASCVFITKHVCWNRSESCVITLGDLVRNHVFWVESVHITD